MLRMAIYSVYLKIWLFFLFPLSYGIIPETRRDAFLCSGQLSEVCRTGLCYDSLQISNSTLISGCADSSICLSNGCYYDGKYFICCCSRALCNGKSMAFLQSKWRHYVNENIVVRPYPFRYLRNAVTVPTTTTTMAKNQETESPMNQESLDKAVDVIKSEINSLTTNLEPISAIVKENEQNTELGTTTIPLRNFDEKSEAVDKDKDTSSTSRAYATQTTTIVTDETIPTKSHFETPTLTMQRINTSTWPSTTSTTTVMSTLLSTLSTSTILTTKKKDPVVTKKHLELTTTSAKITSSLKKETTTTKSPYTSLRTTTKITQKFTQPTSRKPSVFADTTAPPASEKRNKLHMSESKPVTAKPAPKQPPSPPEAYTHATFPWYIIAGVGFIVSVIVSILVYLFFRKCVCVQSEKTELEENGDESNHVLEANETEIKEMTSVDPLLKDQNGKGPKSPASPKSPKAPSSGQFFC